MVWRIDFGHMQPLSFCTDWSGKHTTRMPKLEILSNLKNMPLPLVPAFVPWVAAAVSAAVSSYYIALTNALMEKTEELKTIAEESQARLAETAREKIVGGAREGARETVWEPIVLPLWAKIKGWLASNVTPAMQLISACAFLGLSLTGFGVYVGVYSLSELRRCREMLESGIVKCDRADSKADSRPTTKCSTSSEDIASPSDSP